MIATHQRCELGSYTEGDQIVLAIANHGVEVSLSKEHLLGIAVEAMLSPDPYLSEPDPETVAAVTEFVRLMCEVSKRRPEAYKDEPWKGIEAVDHFEHAYEHAGHAYEEDVSTGKGELAIDGDGLPHAAHAGLRLAFGVARMRAR